MPTSNRNRPVILNPNIFLNTKVKTTKREQSRETANIGYTRRRKTKKKLIIICAGHHYTETNTNNVNKTCKYVFVLLDFFVF
jgi:L-2-hydroxyglutarate oxidase LhgO